jgi:peroxiredoxin
MAIATIMTLPVFSRLITGRAAFRVAFASRRMMSSVSSLQSTPAGSLRDVNGSVVNPSEHFADKKAVIISVPGAFTPVCTNQHLPGFIAKADAFKKAGVDVIACV